MLSYPSGIGAAVSGPTSCSSVPVVVVVANVVVGIEVGAASCGEAQPLVREMSAIETKYRHFMLDSLPVRSREPGALHLA